MDYLASAVMNRDVKTVTPETTLIDLDQMLVQDDVSGYPVLEGQRVVGVVTRSDIIRHLSSAAATIPELTTSYYTDSAATAEHGQPILPTCVPGQDPSAVCVRDLMSRKLLYVSPDEPLHRVADIMYQQRVHRVLVLKENNLIGIITCFDFARLYARDRIGAEGRPELLLDF